MRNADAGHNGRPAKQERLYHTVPERFGIRAVRNRIQRRKQRRHVGSRDTPEDMRARRDADLTGQALARRAFVPLARKDKMPAG